MPEWTRSGIASMREIASWSAAAMPSLWEGEDAEQLDGSGLRTHVVAKTADAVLREMARRNNPLGR